MDIVEESNATLRCIEQNDPKLKSLAIVNQGHTTGHTSEACFWLHDSADVSRLGNAIANNTHLKSIELGESSDWTRDTTPLLEGIQRNTAINHLSLHDGIGIGVLDQFANIRSLTQLDNLGLIRCDLRGAIARSLAQAMKKCPNLNEIFMFNCKLDDASLKDIALGMRGIPLQKLGLFNYSFTSDNNTIGMEGAEAMKNLLQDPNCILTNLYLNSAGFNTESIQLIVNGLRGNTKLEHLTLSASGITIQTAAEIGSLLQNPSCNINHLDLGHCGMNDESAATIVRSLMGNTKLKNLRLAGNNIGTSSSESIITLLQDPNCNINHLDIGDCGFKNESAAKLVTSLRGNTKLEQLGLSGNKLERSGCESIATLLQDRNSNINKILLTKCKVDNECAAFTCKVLDR